jgi:hypothetical protein
MYELDNIPIFPSTWSNWNEVKNYTFYFWVTLSMHILVWSYEEAGDFWVFKANTGLLKNSEPDSN